MTGAPQPGTRPLVRTPIKAKSPPPPPEGSSPLIVVKEDFDQDSYSKWLSSKAGWVEANTETDFEPTNLYQYQTDYLNDPSDFRHIDKSRQTGFSYVFACEGVVDSHRMRRHTQIFISINQEEANEKVIYARALYESVPLKYQRKLITDNKKMLEFESYTGQNKARTRIVSHAQREPRGKGGNTKVVLDECAHYMFGDKIYIAALPIVTRGEGSITLGSTPLGKSGLHWDVMSRPEMKRVYSYHRVFWWHCPDFVKEGRYEEALAEAPKHNTSYRVEKYGNRKMLSIFMSMDLESFQQEYECHHIDDTVSYFPMRLLDMCIYQINTDNIFLEDDPNVGEVLEYPIQKKFPKVKFEYFKSIEELLYGVRDGTVKGPMYAGFDVGRRHHTAELIIFEEHPSDLMVMRMRRSFKNEDFALMQAELKYALNNLNILRMGIDETGPGIQLAEEMQKLYPGVCEGISFTAQWKEEVCAHVRRMLESQMIALPDDNRVKGQMHSIKRIVTEHGNLRLDAEKNKEHHGDIFWGLALACNYVSRSYSAFNPTSSIYDPEEREDLAVVTPRPAERIFIAKSPIIQHLTVPGLGFGPNAMRKREM